MAATSRTAKSHTTWRLVLPTSLCDMVSTWPSLTAFTSALSTGRNDHAMRLRLTARSHLTRRRAWNQLLQAYKMLGKEEFIKRLRASEALYRPFAAAFLSSQAYPRHRNSPSYGRASLQIMRASSWVLLLGTLYRGQDDVARDLKKFADDVSAYSIGGNKKISGAFKDLYQYCLRDPDAASAFGYLPRALPRPTKNVETAALNAHKEHLRRKWETPPSILKQVPQILERILKDAEWKWDLQLPPMTMGACLEHSRSEGGLKRYLMEVANRPRVRESLRDLSARALPVDDHHSTLMATASMPVVTHGFPTRIMQEVYADLQSSYRIKMDAHDAHDLKSLLRDGRYGGTSIIDDTFTSHMSWDLPDAVAVCVSGKGSKVRVVTKSPASLIVLAHYIRRPLLRILKRLGHTRYALLGDRVEAIKKLFPVSGANRLVYSSDLRACSDLIPLDLVNEIWEYLEQKFRFPPWVRTVWRMALGPQEILYPERNYFVKSKTRKGGFVEEMKTTKASSIVSERGILMGLPLTWVTVELCQLIWVECARRLMPLSPVAGPEPFTICGDDLLGLWHKRMIRNYQHTVVACGGQFSDSNKNVESNCGGVFTNIRVLVRTDRKREVSLRRAYYLATVAEKNGRHYRIRYGEALGHHWVKEHRQTMYFDRVLACVPLGSFVNPSSDVNEPHGKLDGVGQAAENVLQLSHRPRALSRVISFLHPRLYAEGYRYGLWTTGPRVLGGVGLPARNRKEDTLRCVPNKVQRALYGLVYRVSHRKLQRLPLASVWGPYDRDEVRHATEVFFHKAYGDLSNIRDSVILHDGKAPPPGYKDIGDLESVHRDFCTRYSVWRDYGLWGEVRPVLVQPAMTREELEKYDLLAREEVKPCALNKVAKRWHEAWSEGIGYNVKIAHKDVRPATLVRAYNRLRKQNHLALRGYSDSELATVALRLMLNPESGSIGHLASQVSYWDIPGEFQDWKQLSYGIGKDLREFPMNVLRLCTSAGTGIGRLDVSTGSLIDEMESMGPMGGVLLLPTMTGGMVLDVSPDVTIVRPLDSSLTPEMQNQSDERTIHNPVGKIVMPSSWRELYNALQKLNVDICVRIKFGVEHQTEEAKVHMYMSKGDRQHGHIPEDLNSLPDWYLNILLNWSHLSVETEVNGLCEYCDTVQAARAKSFILPYPSPPKSGSLARTVHFVRALGKLNV